MKKSHQIISWFVLLLLNLLLLFINSRLNTFLSPWGLHLYWDGLLIAYPVLNMGTLPGLLLMITTGFFRDAMLPVDFGQHMLLYSGIFLFVRALQRKWNIDLGSVIHLITQTSNLVLILVNGLTFFPASQYWMSYASQMLIMILLSQGSLAFITLWVYQLQYCAMIYLVVRFDNSKTSQLL